MVLAGAGWTLCLTRSDDVLVVMLHGLHVAGAILVRLIYAAYIVMSLGLRSHKYVTMTIRTITTFLRLFILVVRTLVERGLIL